MENAPVFDVSVISEAIRTGSSTAGGSTRKVIPFLDKYVIKIPHSHKSCWQSRAEIKVWQTCPDEYRDLLVPILAHFMIEDMEVIIMPKVKVIEQELDEMEMSSYVEYFSYGGYLKSIFEIFKLEGKYQDYTRRVDDFRSAVGLNGYGDIYNNTGNMGIMDGRLVILDYGFIWNA